MLELSTKGVEELGKVKNRVARLYGMGRIDLDTFNSLHGKILDLENLFKEAIETDDGSNQSQQPNSVLPIQSD